MLLNLSLRGSDDLMRTARFLLFIAAIQVRLRLLIALLLCGLWAGSRS